MVKKIITTNKGIRIGREANTLLNLLIGANSKLMVDDEIGKINYLKSNSERIDIITDLSLYKGTNRLWEYVLKNTNYMAGTVPVYHSVNDRGTVDENILFELICEQCEKGVSIITIHPTVNYDMLELSKKRVIPCTSRGGGIVAWDYIYNKRDVNIYLKLLDKIGRKCKEHKVILSIGSTFRSGTILDALDQTYLEELDAQIKIANYLNKLGIDTIIETPGHVDAKKLMELCDKLRDIPYPIMPLGPMLTDIGLDEDDMVAVIGASLMGIHDSADILSIVTSREHRSGVPDIEEIKHAISKYQIARHIIDLYKISDDSEDYQIAKERARMKSCDALSQKDCERCGSFCPLKVMDCDRKFTR